MSRPHFHQIRFAVRHRCTACVVLAAAILVRAEFNPGVSLGISGGFSLMPIETRADYTVGGEETSASFKRNSAFSGNLSVLFLPLRFIGLYGEAGIDYVSIAKKYHDAVVIGDGYSMVLIDYDATMVWLNAGLSAYPRLPLGKSLAIHGIAGGGLSLGLKKEYAYDTPSHDVSDDDGYGTAVLFIQLGGGITVIDRISLCVKWMGRDYVMDHFQEEGLRSIQFTIGYLLRVRRRE